MIIDRKDITIAGAGPAGMAASIVLAKAGYHVRVFEQRSGVGGRFNDDFQGLENWSRAEDAHSELKQAGVEPTWWSRPFCDGVLYDPNLRPIHVTTPRPLFYMVRRGADHPDSLDLALQRQAQAAGVEFVFNRRLAAGQADILATGPRGNPEVIAAGITAPIDRADLAAVILSDDLAPAGYVYFLIADRQATLATVLFQNFKDVHRCMDRSMEAIRQLFGIDGFPSAKHWGGYGSFSIPETCELGRSLIVGEAAGFQDFLFGFGIRSAVVSGILAARSIIEKQSFDALWRARLLPHLQASLVNRAVYGRLRLAKKLFWYATGNNSRPDNFMRWLYDFSPLHRVIYPFVAARK